MGLLRRKCNRCGERGAHHKWTVHPCALDKDGKRKTIKGRLCTRCDIELNAFILSWFRVPKRRELMKAYEELFK